MPIIYRPIQIKKVSAVNANLISLRYCHGQLLVDYSTDDVPIIVRASIPSVATYRLVDGVTMPSDEIEQQEGLSPDNMLYLVSGAKYAEQFRPMIEGRLLHFRFVTGISCLDVLTTARPHIRKIGHSADEGSSLQEQ